MKKTTLLLLIFFNCFVIFSQRFGELTYNTKKLNVPTYNLSNMLETQNKVKEIATNYKPLIKYLEIELKPKKCNSLLGRKCLLYKKEISRMKTEFLKLEYSNEYFENRAYIISSVKKMNKIDFELGQSLILKRNIEKQKEKIKLIEKNLTSIKCENLKRRCKKIKKSISKIKKRQDYFIKKSSYINYSDEISEFEFKIEEINYKLK